MSYPEGEMPEPKDQSASELPTASPELTEYADEYLRRIEEVLADPEKRMSLAEALAAERFKLEQAADRDPLTGLYNKHGVSKEFARTLLRLRRRLATKAEGEKPIVPGSFLMIDLDHFKQTNDSMGHPFGDNVLRVISAVLDKSVRPDDMVYRYGGEEIAVVLPDCTLNNAIGVAERLRNTIPDSIAETLNEYRQTISIGVAQMEQVTADQLELPEIRERLFSQALGAADEAMYFAKKSGRNRTAFKDPQNRLGILEPDPNNLGQMVVRYQDP